MTRRQEGFLIATYTVEELEGQRARTCSHTYKGTQSAMRIHVDVTERAATASQRSQVTGWPEPLARACRPIQDPAAIRLACAFQAAVC
jgi:hypothetical protein